MLTILSLFVCLPIEWANNSQGDEQSDSSDGNNSDVSTSKIVVAVNIMEYYGGTTKSPLVLFAGMI
jgi:hypothetical protein